MFNFKEMRGCLVGAFLMYFVLELLRHKTKWRSNKMFYNAEEVYPVMFRQKARRRHRRKAQNVTHGSIMRNYSMSVYIHSGPALFEGRKDQRRRCFPEYEKHGLKATFVVARPSFDSRPHDAHAQGQLGTAKEHELSEKLLSEYQEYGDILFLPHRDYYRDMTEKLIGYLKYDFDYVGSDFVFKTDDEYCLRLGVIDRLIEKHKKDHGEKELYAGTFLFQGTEYESMKGPHKELAPFMSGASFGISKGLVKDIISDHWAHTCMYHAYGTSSDDANIGKWISYAKETSGLETEYVVGNINYELPPLNLNNGWRVEHNRTHWKHLDNTDITGCDLQAVPSRDVMEGIAECERTKSCVGLVLYEGISWLKSCISDTIISRPGRTLWIAPIEKLATTKNTNHP